MSGARTNNKLKAREMLLLCKWVESAVEQLNGLTRAQQAAIGEAALGFRLTASNINAAINATGVTIEPSRPAPVSADDRVAVLARAFVDLCAALGCRVPPEVAALAKS